MSSHRTCRFGLCLAILISGCAAQPQSQEDQGVVAVRSREQIMLDNEADVKAAREAAEYQDYVCAQPEPEQRALIKETAEKQGWQIACPNNK